MSDGGDERAVGGDVAVGHAGSVEGEAGIAVAVEEGEAAGGVSAMSKEVHGFASGEHGMEIFAAGLGSRRMRSAFPGGNVDDRAGRSLRHRAIVLRHRGRTQKFNGGFGHDDFHDGFAVTGAGDAASGRIGVTAAADERGIADAAGKFAASAAGGGGGEEFSMAIEGDGADGALLVTAMVGSGVFVPAATLPRFALGGGDEILGVAERDALLYREAFGTLGDEHHVRAVFQDGAGETDGVAHALQRGDGAGTECGAVHDDGVAFDAAIEIQVRAEAGIENRLVFEDDDGGFDGIERGAARAKHGPASGKGAMAAGFARVDGFVGDIPGSAVNDERRIHPKNARTAARINNDASDKKIEQEEKRAENQKHCAKINAMAGKTAERADKLGRDGLEAGLFAEAIERADDSVAGKTAAEGTGFLVHPDEDCFTIAPGQGRADHENNIAEKS